MIEKTPITLMTLQPEYHVEALQRVYEETPAYWLLHDLPSVVPGQAERDLDEAAKVAGRYMLGIVRRLQRTNPQAGAELVGLLDYRLHWPDENICYLGMIMVAEPYQRTGIGRKAWRLLLGWLKKEAETDIVRLGVEQFNSGALKFFQSLGFQLTGEANRVRSGEKLVRYLSMEYRLNHETVHN